MWSSYQTFIINRPSTTPVLGVGGAETCETCGAQEGRFRCDRGQIDRRFVEKKSRFFFFSFNPQPPSPSKPRLGSRSPFPQLEIRRRSRTPCPGFITHFHLRNPSHFFPLRRTQQQLAGVDAKVNAFFFSTLCIIHDIISEIGFLLADIMRRRSAGRRMAKGGGRGGEWRD